MDYSVEAQSAREDVAQVLSMIPQGGVVVVYSETIDAMRRLLRSALRKLEGK